MKIEFEVYGQPIAKGRPRVTKRGITYTPQKTKSWEEYVRLVAQNHIPKGGLLEGPLLMDLSFMLLKGKSVKREWPTTIPDWDNLGKAISDSLEGMIYRNDSQIVVFRMRKTYAQTPGVKVVIEEM